MMPITQRAIAAVLTTLMVVGPMSAAAQQQGGVTTQQPAGQQPAGQVQQQGGSNNRNFTIRVESNMVLTNVVVRDKKTGEIVKDLKASDFTILENNKSQKIASFDFQNVDEAAALSEKTTVSGKASVADILNNQILGVDDKELRDHRLIVMFFDLSSMQPEDLDRAVEAAQNYINKKMEPADLVACVSFATALNLDQDFSNDKATLLRTVGRYNGSEGAGFGAGNEGGDSEGTSDDGSTYVADDTEFNTLNTDRELYAIQAIARSLQRLDQRKSMLLFSGGMTRQGIENQASLRAATNAAVKANMAIYTQDTRGLQTISALGSASKGSTRGTSSFSGASMQSALNSNFSSQETLSTMASDTGGKAFFDSNDFGPVFQQIQHDTQAYYILGYRPSNDKRDGTYRHLSVKVNRPDVQVETRTGYYAQADFVHANTQDREQMLVEQMRSDLPATDVQVLLQALYFRLTDNSFFIPISLIVPARYIPFIKNGDKSKATIDVMGQVKNAQGIIVGQARDTVKLNLDESQQVQSKNVQYNTGFQLAPGRYHLKFIVRENQTGQTGSFETDIVVPDLRKSSLKLSSVVVSNQRAPNAKKSVSPLVRDGLEWEQNVPHVFRTDQHMYFLYEVYDPTKQSAAVSTPPAAGAAPAPAAAAKPDPTAPVKVLTSIQFINASGVKVLETPLVEHDAIDVPERNAVAFQFDVPLNKLNPGSYICQIQVIDDAGMSFSFPRLAVIVRGPAPAAPPAAPAAAAASNPRAM